MPTKAQLIEENEKLKHDAKQQEIIAEQVGVRIAQLQKTIGLLQEKLTKIESAMLKLIYKD